MRPSNLNLSSDRRTLSGTAAIVAASLALIASLPAASLAAPATMAVEGVLLSSGGGPVADGVYKMGFALYTAPKGGTAEWSEPALNVEVKGGRFVHVLGEIKALSPAALAAMPKAWLGLKVGVDPELPRTPMHAVPWASSSAVAGSLKCSGCVGTGQLATGAVSPAKVGFTYAGAKTKGGPANAALDLQCTGCVSVAEMKFDKDVDLGGLALKAKSLSAGTVSAGVVSAGSFLGDGSKLSGIKIPTGSCPKAGEVVKGVKADGTLVCVAAMDASGLPPDGIDEISNDLIHNQFVDTVVSKKVPVPIPDNKPPGVTDTIVFPDVGIAQKLTVHVKASSSNIAQLELQLFDPNKVKYLLYKKNGAGKVIDTAFPAPSKPLEGDLTTWVGKNPQGKWVLKAIDHTFLNNKIDGAIESWSISIQTLSNKKVRIKGNLLVDGSVKFGPDNAPCTAQKAGTIRWNGSAKAFQACNGSIWSGLQGPDGSTKAAAAVSCNHIKAAYPNSPSGQYWIDPNGGSPEDAFTARCDMIHHGGGWTLAMNLDTNDGAIRHYGDTAFWTKAGAYYGKVASALKGDFKGKPYDLVPATEIMIEAHVEGSTKGTAAYAFGGSWSKRTLQYLFSHANNSTVTGARVASSGSIGNAGHQRNAGDAFIDHSHPLIFNSTWHPADASNLTRIGTNYGSVCGTITCNGHNYGGLGGRHYRGGWGCYYEAAQLNGYCLTQGAYGTNGSAYKGNNAFYNPSQCGGTAKRRDMDFAIWVR